MGIRPGPDGRPAWVSVLSTCYWMRQTQRLSKSVAAINVVSPLTSGEERSTDSHSRQASAANLTALGNLFRTQQQCLQIILINIQQFTVL